MAAVLGGMECDVAVLLYAAGANRFIGDKGVVLSGDQEEGHADPVHYALGPGRFVVFLCVAIAEIRRRNGVVKFTDGADQTKTVARVCLRKELCFLGETGQQPGDEMALVEIVVGPLE